MSPKERKPKNKPEMPPEMAEAQNESGLPPLPENIPQYLAYSPAADTGASLAQLQAILHQIDHKLQTNNHLQAHPMMQEMVLPSQIQLFDWMFRSLRDVVVYAQNLASWSVERHVVPAVPPKLAAAVLEHLAKGKTLRELLKGHVMPLLTTALGLSADDVGTTEQKEAVAMAEKLIKELDEEAPDLEEEIDEDTFDEDEDGWDDEDDLDDEDFDDEEGDEEGDEDVEPEDLVDTMEPGAKRKPKTDDPDAEPLF